MERQRQAGIRDGGRGWATGLGVTLWIAAAVRYAHMLPKLPSRATAYDFSLYYISGWALRAGLDPYRADLPAIGQRLHCAIRFAFRCNYTPPFVALMAPLTRWPVSTAFWIWVGASAAAFAAALAIMFKLARVKLAPALATTAALLIFPPVTVHLKYSQSQFIILLLLVLVLAWTRRGWDRAAGLVLGAAALFKAYPILMAGYFVARRKWRALRWTAAGVVIGAAVASIWMPPASWIEFVRNNGADPYALMADNIALPAFVTRVYFHLFSSAGSSLARHGIITALQILVVIIALRATAAGDDAEGYGFSVWIVAMLLVTPLVWLHYMPLLAIPIIQSVAAADDGRLRRRTLAAMAIACGLITVSWPLSLIEPRHGAAELLSEFGTFGMIAAYAWVLLLARDAAAGPTRAGLRAEHQM